MPDGQTNGQKGRQYICDKAASSHHHYLFMFSHLLFLHQKKSLDVSPFTAEEGQKNRFSLDCSSSSFAGNVEFSFSVHLKGK
jgi:hypothetical protein